MKKNTVFIISFFSAMFIGITVFADEPAPLPEAGLGRIAWAIKCAGNAPVPMYIAMAVLAVCIIITVVYYKKISGGDK